MNKQSNEPDEELLPEELVIQFSRCQNYPRDALGVQLLAQGLRRASERAGVPMKEIVERCAETSQWCPTDADLLNIARDLAASHAAQTPPALSQTEQWEREYGKPRLWSAEEEFAKQRLDLPGHPRHGWLWTDIIARADRERKEALAKVREHLGVAKLGSPANRTGKSDLNRVSDRDYRRAVKELGLEAIL